MHLLRRGLQARIAALTVALFVGTIVMAAVSKGEDHVNVGSGRIAAHSCQLGTEHRYMLLGDENVLIQYPSPEVQMNIGLISCDCQDWGWNSDGWSMHSLPGTNNKGNRFLICVQIRKPKILWYRLRQQLPIDPPSGVTAGSSAAILNESLKIPSIEMLWVGLIRNPSRLHGLIEEDESTLNRYQPAPRGLRSATGGFGLNNGLIGKISRSIRLLSGGSGLGPRYLGQSFHLLRLKLRCGRKIMRINTTAVHLHPLHNTKENYTHRQKDNSYISPFRLVSVRIAPPLYKSAERLAWWMISIIVCLGWLILIFSFHELCRVPGHELVSIGGCLSGFALCAMFLWIFGRHYDFLVH
jgi:hypothetical protein